jgi:hypothetical protein
MTKVEFERLLQPWTPAEDEKLPRAPVYALFASAAMGQRDNVPARSVSCQLQKKGWIEQQRQGPKNETFNRITDAGLAALKAPVPIQASRAKLQSTGVLVELRAKK